MIRRPTDKQLRCLKLRHQGLSYREIARRVGCAGSSAWRNVRVAARLLGTDVDRPGPRWGLFHVRGRYEVRRLGPGQDMTGYCGTLAGRRAGEAYCKRLNREEAS